MGKVSAARTKWNKDHSGNQEDEDIDKNSLDEENDKMEKVIAEGIRDEVEWLANLLDQFETANSSPKAHKGVVFLSTGARKYFPEDPGSSRFGVAYSMMKAPGEVPNPNYLPPNNRLYKPAIISAKGYGIGGLSAPRFAKDVRDNNPAPNAYNILPEIPVPPKRRSTLKALEFASHPSSTTFTADDGKKSSELDLSSIVQQSHELNPIKLSKAQLRNLCLQTFISFGSTLAVPRMGKDPKWHCVGVGYYDLRKEEGRIRKACSFGQKPVRLIPPAVTRCNWKGPDKCFECQKVLRTEDYYRTMTRIKNPFYQVNPDDRVHDDDFGFHEEIATDEGDGKDNLMERRNVFVSLCRACYCRGIRGQSRFWDRKELPSLFVKTRHCGYVHDHQSISIFTHKTDCALIGKLSRKEILLSKYYKDTCDRVVKSS